VYSQNDALALARMESSTTLVAHVNAVNGSQCETVLKEHGVRRYACV